MVSDPRSDNSQGEDSAIVLFANCERPLEVQSESGIRLADQATMRGKQDRGRQEQISRKLDEVLHCVAPFVDLQVLLAKRVECRPVVWVRGLGSYLGLSNRQSLWYFPTCQHCGVEGSHQCCARCGIHIPSSRHDMRHLRVDKGVH